MANSPWDKKNDDLDDETWKEFWSWVHSVVKHNYKEGVFSEKRTQKALSKAWSSDYAHMGIAEVVRKKLGEKAATKLYQITVDDIRNDEELMGYIIQAHNAKNIEDVWNSK